MIILNPLSQSFAKRSFFSIVSNCTSRVVNSRARVLQGSIYYTTFSKAPENDGFCFQEFVSLVQNLGEVKEVRYGKSLHSICIKAGFDSDVFVHNNIMRFYADCGDMLNARLLFDELPEPNLVSWTSIISSYVHDGQYDIGLYMFYLMCWSRWRPNEFGYSVVLKACRITSNFIMGMLIHGQILKCGFESYSFCNAAILGMYVEYGDIENACKVFSVIPLWERSEALCNTLLHGFVQTSTGEKALKLFREMMCSNLTPNYFTYTILIKLCLNMLNLNLGRSFHGRIVKVGYANDVIVGGALVDTYAKLGFLDDACKMFRDLEQKDNVVWCALLAGFHQIGDAEQGLTFYLRFLSEGNKPDPFTYASVFSLCSNLESEVVGTQIHCSFIKYGFKMDSFLGSALIDMYGSMGMISDAYECFFEVGFKNEICFSVMINSLISCSCEEKALELLSEMRKLGIAPRHSTLSYMLRACANLCMLKEGRSVHSHIIRHIDDPNPNQCIENALIEMYTKCGVVDKARMVFKDMEMPNEFSWTTIMSGYTESGKFKEALGLFNDMLLSVFTKPSQYTVIIVLQACAKLEVFGKGKQIHGYIIKVGFESHPFVQSALINMYAASKHEIENSYVVFSSMSEQDLISWSSMITAWTRNGYDRESLNLFAEFQKTPVFAVDESVLSSCLSACAGLVTLDMGKWFHACIIRTGFEAHLHVASSLIDMYSKCGSIKDARKLFDELREPNLVSCTAMMSGYAHHGLGQEAIELFNEMKEYGLKLDGVTFIGILTACSHAGLVNEAWQYFECMKRDYSLEVTINHYACMIDLLGRAEQIDAAEALINEAPFQSKTLLWKTLLGACNKHGKIEAGNRIAQILVEMEPNEPSTYVLLSNIYASASMWDNSTEVRKQMKEENVSKLPGYSWIQVAS